MNIYGHWILFYLYCPVKRPIIHIYYVIKFNDTQSDKTLDIMVEDYSDE
jgi:hypothetical protein